MIGADVDSGAGTVAAFQRRMTLPSNLVTIDLDDRGQGEPSHLEAVADSLLDGLARTETVATFFTTRCVAEARAPLIRRLTEAGHDVACLTTTTPACRSPYCADFRSDLLAAKGAIESATGSRARGHRAAGFGMNAASEWAYDVLVDAGFDYDSSRFPERHTEYGFAPVPRTVHALRRWGGTLLEVPASTADVLALRLQVGTTTAVRGLPLLMWRHLVEARQSRGEPVVLHLKSAEMRRGDGRTRDQMVRLLGAFPFTSVTNALPDLLRSAPVVES